MRFILVNTILSFLIQIKNDVLILASYVINIFFIDFTRLKLVQGKKGEENEEKENTPYNAAKDNDITAQYDAQDDADVVF